ncbi:hypothetical protein CDL15_Pgr009684 [Punica granatum]|uniref:WAT1-related protein n=1 Tax=Punica granatum TaxID=22663 RepID=A0A218WU56_PUNGR|nr:hypothetical protein CDL15_Pgr009684 [Punica granatum]
MWRRVWSSSATFASMILAVVAQASSRVVNKLAMSGGTNKFVLACYSNSLFLLLPFLIFPWRLNFELPCRFFGQIFGFIGIDYSSPTLDIALMNLIPAFTFILAVIFSFYKGPPLTVPTTIQLHLSPQSRRVLGGFFLAGVLMIASCYIVQAFVIEDYPEVLIITFYFNFYLTTLAVSLSTGRSEGP